MGSNPFEPDRETARKALEEWEFKKAWAKIVMNEEKIVMNEEIDDGNIVEQEFPPMKIEKDSGPPEPTDDEIYCPFFNGPCPAGCTSMRERLCINGP